MSIELPFKHNNHITIGVELELQLIDLENYNLAMESLDFVRRLSEISFTGEIKPEITQSMIEINSSIHHGYNPLLQELKSLRNTLAEQALQSNIGICGGGTHPFQKWSDQRIYPSGRFSNLFEQYGYLAKQFTVFGQHIHIACADGDTAMYLCHAFARYLPHFIAMSASSPFYQSVDTAFDCSRLTGISAFPLSGMPPWLFTWAEFENYFTKMHELAIVKTMKDFYWDIRPKPEYGTIEIRISDTPLTINKAAELAAYAQMLTYYLLEHRPELSPEIYLTYSINRFRAARYGFEALIIDPAQRTQIPLFEDILKTCDHLTKYAEALGSSDALTLIYQSVSNRENGALWLRQRYFELNSLTDVVRAQIELWFGDFPQDRRPKINVSPIAEPEYALTYEL